MQATVHFCPQSKAQFCPSFNQWDSLGQTVTKNSSPAQHQTALKIVSILTIIILVLPSDLKMKPARPVLPMIRISLAGRKTTEKITKESNVLSKRLP
jgi:hypothetical protein